jgi:hypothetical protein
MVVGSAVQFSALPEASTPSGNVPAEQFAGFAASAVAVATAPDTFEPAREVIQDGSA